MNELKKQNYITKQEAKRCGKVASVFKELYEKTDTAVINTKYGFVLLKYFDNDGFQKINTYANGNNLFDALWQEWREEKLIELCVDTSLINLEYEEMFKRLSEELQNEIMEARKQFLSKIDSEEESTDITMKRNGESYITDKERNRCRTVADIFKEELENDDIIIEETEKYGFMMLQYFEPKKSFDSAIIFKNSQEMFDMLLDEYFVSQIMELMKERHMTNKDIDVFFDELTKEEKEKLEKKKEKFAEQARKRAPFLKG